MPTKQITINKFDGGTATDPREKDLSRFYHTKHFDVFSFPHKLVPRYDVEDKNNGDAEGLRLFDFAYALGPGSTYRIFALGLISNGRAAVFYYNADTGLWVAPSGNLADEAPLAGSFLEYKGYVYWFGGSTKLKRYKTDDGSGGVTDYQTITSFDYVAQALHCVRDDIAYFFANNLVYKLDNTTWGGAALTLPSYMQIAAVCEYGDYLAIACNYKYEIKSTVFLWDRNTSVATITQRFDFPSTKIYQMAVLDGRLMVVSTDFIKIYTKRFNGSEFERLSELVGVRKSFLEDQMSRYNVIIDNRLYFPMAYDAPGYGTYNTRLGLWAADSRGRIALDFMIDGAASYKGLFYLLGDIWIAHDTTDVAKTTITYSTSLPSIYESLFIGDVRQNKKLMSVGVQTEPLPTAGIVTLKYRMTETSDWTTIFSNSTDNSYYHQAVNIESDGSELTEFKEIQFRVESLGGAVITGIDLIYEEIDDNPN